MESEKSSKQKMIDTLNSELPNFVRMINETKERTVIFHQDAFAVDYQEGEFKLLGMATKYAGLHGMEITILHGKDEGYK